MDDRGENHQNGKPGLCTAAKVRKRGLSLGRTPALFVKTVLLSPAYVIVASDLLATCCATICSAM